MITRNFNLFLNAGNSIPLVINVNQFDSGEQWVFTLFNSDGTQYIPSTGAIVGIKSDGLGIINSGSVNESGQVVISETQQMTAAVGKAVFELMIDNQTHGTANFIVLVEEKPGNNADLSESDLSLLEEAINATSPLPTGGTVGQVLTKTANGSTWSDAGTPTQEQVAEAVSDWADENITVTTGVVIDTSLSVAGAAADAKKTGDEIGDLKSAISGGGMSAEFKVALENLVSHVAFSGDDPTGQTYIDALHTAMYPPANLTSITAVYTQSGTVYNTDSLDDLKTDLVVTAHYDNGTSEIVSTYTLSGTLSVGTSTITVAYGGETTTFSVTVTEYVPPSTQPVIEVENMALTPTSAVPNSRTASTGFGITKEYSYSFSQSAIENCQYYDSTNDYMSTNGWCGIKYYVADVNTLAAGNSWLSSNKSKHVAVKDDNAVTNSSITKNSEAGWSFSRYNHDLTYSNGLRFTLPLLDLDDCYAFWFKPMTGSILPDGVSEGDIIFAGANTQYYGLTNISEAES